MKDEEPTNPAAPSILAEVRDLVARGNAVLARIEELAQRMFNRLEEVNESLLRLRTDTDRRLTALEHRMNEVENRQAAAQ